jgi:hypothetical protein
MRPENDTERLFYIRSLEVMIQRFDEIENDDFLAASLLLRAARQSLEGLHRPKE